MSYLILKYSEKCLNRHSNQPFKSKIWFFFKYSAKIWRWAAANYWPKIHLNFRCTKFSLFDPEIQQLKIVYGEELIENMLKKERKHRLKKDHKKVVFNILYVTYSMFENTVYSKTTYSSLGWVCYIDQSY